MLEKKGQTSFELVLLVGTVLIITTAVLGRYVSVGDETMALAAAKQSIIEKFSIQSKVLIEKIEFEDCAARKYLKIKTIPATLDSASLNQREYIIAITEEVSKVSSIDSFDILVNENTPCEP